MLSLEQIQNLEKVINTTWGRSSTNGSKSPTMSITCRLLDGERAELKYLTIINMGDYDMVAVKRQNEEQALKLVKQCMQKIRDDYKEESGESIKITLKNHNVSLEAISPNSYGGVRRPTYFRLNAILELE